MRRFTDRLSGILLAATRVLAVGLVAALAVGLAGCENAFEPFTEDVPGVALYGVLDARSDTQWVRAEAIRRTPDEALEPPRVTLRSEFGDEVSLRDTTLVLSSGQPVSAAFGLLRPQPGRTYRLEAARRDALEVAASADVTVPVEPTVVLSPPSELGGRVVQVVTINQLDGTPFGLRVRYRLTQDGIARTYTAPYSGTPIGSALRVTVFLERDAEAMLERFGEGLRLLDVRLELALEGAVVTPTGGPGAVGVVGTGGRTWTLPISIAQQIGLDG